MKFIDTRFVIQCTMLACLGLWVQTTIARAGTSELWGKGGELWDGPGGRLGDFSYAGYHMGEDPIPTIPVVKDLKADFGAKGDGVTDDTQAFKDAIVGTHNGALYIPAGTYILSDQIRIWKSNLVIRGAGPDQTILNFTKGLAEIQGADKRFGYHFFGLLQFGAGTKSSESRYGAFGGTLTTVSAEAARGSTQFEVADASGLSVGTWYAFKSKDVDWARNAHLNKSEPYSYREAFFVFRIEAIEGNTITINQPVRTDVIPSLWTTSVVTYQPQAVECGVEDLRIKFNPTRITNEKDSYSGYDALAFKNSFNCWAKNISIQNAGCGIALGASKNVTMSGIEFISRSAGWHIVGDARYKSDYNYWQDTDLYGHHGISFQFCTQDCRLEDFYFDKTWNHTTTFSTEANGNVVRRGSSAQVMTFDSHCQNPYENLITNTSTGPDNWRYYYSTGPGGKKHAARLTYWYVYSDARPKLRRGQTDLGYSTNIQMTIVGGDSADSGGEDVKTSTGEWFEDTGDGVYPADIYASQLAYRTGIGDTFYTWAARKGIPADLTDTDGDGVSNLMEYAIDRDPMVAEKGSSGFDGAGTPATLSFLRARADLTYVVQKSADLNDWEDYTTNPGVVGELVTVAVPALDGASSVFLRLEVSVSPF